MAALAGRQGERLAPAVAEVPAVAAVRLAWAWCEPRPCCTGAQVRDRGTGATGLLANQAS